MKSHNREKVTSKETAKQWCSRLLWVYFFLWVFEGALRKWVLPAASDPLLIIRDPVVIAIYCIALVNRLFPWNSFLSVSTILGVICTCLSLIVLPDAPFVILFGLRTDFLFLPVIFLIPRIWDSREIRRLGFVILITALPMALLILAQFLSTPTSWINAGAGGSMQITTARGHIRPAGTFSYNTGSDSFYSLVVAFILTSQLTESKNYRYPIGLIIVSIVAVLVAGISSGSRTFLVDVAIVLVVGFISISLIRPKLILRLVGVFLMMGILLFGVSQTGFFAEGASTLTSRLSDSNGDVGNGIQQGLFVRALYDLTSPFDKLVDVPVLGYGLGTGTIAGNYLQSRVHTFTEIEWERNMSESGFALGLAFISLRVYLLLFLISRTFVLYRKGNVLPLLLLSTTAPLILNGQLGQPSALGFTIFFSGCALCPGITNDSKCLR